MAIAARAPASGPDSTLIFEVELLSIQDKSKEKAPEQGKDPGQEIVA